MILPTSREVRRSSSSAQPSFVPIDDAPPNPVNCLVRIGELQIQGGTCSPARAFGVASIDAGGKRPPPLSEHGEPVPSAPSGSRVRVAEPASTTAWMDRNRHSKQIWSAIMVGMRLVTVAVVRFVQEQQQQQQQLLLPLSF
jgi:hypothetical protein